MNEAINKERIKIFSEISLRVIRAFAYFYMIATPLLNLNNPRLAIGTALLCLGMVGISNLLLKKIRGNKKIV